MKLKMNVQHSSITGVIILLLLLFIPFTLRGQTSEPKINRYVEYSDPIEYARNRSYGGWEAAYNNGYAKDLVNYRKEVAPLSPDRFIRRVKMLFGVDITGHTDDKGHFYFSELVAVFPESQLVRIQQELSADRVPYTNVMRYIPEKHTFILRSHNYDSRYTFFHLEPHPRELSFSDILLYCKWIYYSDMEAYGKLRKGDLSAYPYEEGYGWENNAPNQITNKHLGAARFDVRDRDYDNGYYIPNPCDNVEGRLYSTVGSPSTRINVRDRGYDDNGHHLSNPCDNRGGGLYSPINEDVEFIRALNTVGRDRVTNNISETHFYNWDYNYVSDIVWILSGRKKYDEENRPFALRCQVTEDEYHFVTKPFVDSLRYNPYIMMFLSTKLYLMGPKRAGFMVGSIHEFLRKHKAEFEKYNYFGYTLFRQLAKTGKVDNSWIGVPHTATSVGTVPLRIDPQHCGIVFDSLQSSELFTVYDMGYDDYYLAQCAKPVEEWNRRGKNGYAVCTGRLERVWGYVRKKDVIISSGSNSNIRPFIDWGIVSDADGHANLRNKSDASVIVKQIPSGTWVKILSYDMKDYLVETQDGIQGRIHKSRIVW